MKNWLNCFGARLKNRLLTLLCLSISLSFSAGANAWDFQACKVTEIVIVGAENAHVQLDCVITPRPVCAGASTYFAFDKSTEEGKQYLSVVLTAFASGAVLTGEVHDSACPTYQPNVASLTHLRMAK